MNHLSDDVATQRDLPAVWELFRALSGLVAVVALAGAVAVTTLTEELEGEPPPALPASYAEQTSGAPASAVAVPDTSVFYLVRSPQQAYLADWRETLEGSDRDYRILNARNEAELQTARKAVMDHILAESKATQVLVVDLRDVE